MDLASRTFCNTIWFLVCCSNEILSQTIDSFCPLFRTLCSTAHARTVCNQIYPNNSDVSPNRNASKLRTLHATGLFPIHLHMFIAIVLSNGIMGLAPIKGEMGRQYFYKILDVTHSSICQMA